MLRVSGHQALQLKQNTMKSTTMRTQKLTEKCFIPRYLKSYLRKGHFPFQVMSDVQKEIYQGCLANVEAKHKTLHHHAMEETGGVHRDGLKFVIGCWEYHVLIQKGGHQQDGALVNGDEAESNTKVHHSGL